MIFARRNTLHTAKIDLQADPPAVVGGFRILAEELSAGSYGLTTGPLQTSAAGHFAFLPRTAAVDAPMRTLTRVDLDGTPTEPLDLPPGHYAWVDGVSRDRQWLAFSVFPPEGMPEVRVLELNTGVVRRVSPERTPCGGALWLPDGRIFFGMLAEGGVRLYVSEVRPNAEPRPVFPSDGKHWDTLPVGSWSALTPDGRLLIYPFVAPARNDSDLWARPLDDSSEPRPLVSSSAAEEHPALSPDGKWLTYQSNESGIYQVYVRRFDQIDEEGGEIHMISRNGGQSPFWSFDGDKLFFIAEQRPTSGTVFTADISETDDGFQTTEPRALFDIGELNAAPSPRPLLPMPDGTLLYVKRGDDTEPIRHINVVLNGLKELRPLLSGD
jgi:hypothetical protein